MRQEFRTDGAGPGRRRGGTGIDYEVEVPVPARWSFRGEGIGRSTGWGQAGGGDGAGGELVLRPLDGGPDLVAPKYGLAETGPVRLIARSPGGGGWGDPRRRERELVARDVRDGVVSPEAAREVYGWHDRG